MKKFLLRITLLVIPLLGYSTTTAPATPYTGLDIVFIIDQSGSMQRLDGSALPNDPFGLRFYAPWYAMYWLGEDHLLVHQESTFRFAMVNFGNSVEVWDFGNGSYWQTIDPASRDAWMPTYDDLTEQIQVTMRDDFTQRSLGATNFVTPFMAAQTLFDGLPPTSESRRRVIIVLTDGQPSPPNNDGFTVNSHLAELLAFAIQNFPEPDYRIYVIGMIDANASYWPIVESGWEQITNDPCTSLVCPDSDLDRATVVGSNTEVGQRFQNILQELTQEFPKPADLTVVDSAVIPGPLVVPPYLRSLTFTYFKADPAERLILTDPASKEITIGQPNVAIEGKNGPIEAVRITTPLPGEWFVATDPPGTDVDITMRQIFAQSRLDSPSGPQVQFLPVTVQYGLLDDLGQPLPFYEDTRYRLIVEATIQSGGQSWPIQLTEQQGNVYQARFTPVLTTPHTIYVHAESQDLHGNPIVVFDGEIGDFTVDPAVLVSLTGPTRMQQYDETNFSFELQDSRGFPIRSVLPVEVVVTVTGEPNPPLTLKPQPNGTYQTTYSPQKAGVHSAVVVAAVTDVDGNIYEIANQTLPDFTVIPTIRVGVDLVAPEESEQTDTELWPFNRTPVVITVELRDENGDLVDPTAVFQGDPRQALKLTLTDEEGNDLSNHFTLSPTAQPGIYRAETLDLGQGLYNIRIDAVGELQTGFLYGQTFDTFHLTRVIHPWHIPIAVSSLLALIVIVATTTLAVRRQKHITTHPCTGRLYIVDSASVPQYQIGLDSYNRNYIEIKSGINLLTRVTKIVAACQSEEDNKNGRIQLKVWTDQNKTPLVDRSLGPKGEIRLGNNFWLLKDPTDEQLSRNRFDSADSTNWDEK